jgi:hypothetical protein
MTPLLTLFLQGLAAFLVLLFGILALAVARHQDAFLPVRREAWWLIGAAFTLLGLLQSVQGVIAAPWAYFSGPGTAVYEVYLRWAPVGNHSRGLLVVVFAVLLPLLAQRQPLPRLRELAVVALLLGVLVGGFGGWVEGTLLQERHYTWLATSNTVQLMVLSAALLHALWIRTMDEHLWLSLFAYNLMQALHVGWLSALVWENVPGVWTPSPTYIMLYSAALQMVMLAFVLRRLALARRGVQVPALTDPEPEPEFSTFG